MSWNLKHYNYKTATADRVKHSWCKQRVHKNWLRATKGIRCAELGQSQSQSSNSNLTGCAVLLFSFPISSHWSVTVKSLVQKDYIVLQCQQRGNGLVESPSRAWVSVTHTLCALCIRGPRFRRHDYSVNIISMVALKIRVYSPTSILVSVGAMPLAFASQSYGVPPHHHHCHCCSQKP